MNIDILNLVPDLSKLTGVPQGTLLLLIIVTVKLANVTARVIPDDATGWKGKLRKVCAFVGLYVSSRVTAGVTVTDVAKAALETPPIPAKAALTAAKGSGRVATSEAYLPVRMPHNATAPDTPAPAIKP